MGLVFLVIGLLMVLTGMRGTYAQFGKQIASEFQGGKGSFAYWLIAIVAVGALGYVPALQTISRFLLALVIIVLFLAHKGFFEQFKSALDAGPVAPSPVPSQSGNAATASINSAAGSLGNTNAPGSLASTFSDWLTGKLGVPNWVPLN